MLRLLDTLKLAVAKFKVARMRSIFAGCAVAVAVWLLGFITIAVFAVVNIYNTALSRFIDARPDLRFLANIADNAVQIVGDMFKYVGTVVFIIAGLFILSTIAKIASESTKEVGILRALGATHFKVGQIFYSYVFLINLVGYLIGIILAYLSIIFINLQYRGSYIDLFAQATQFVDTSSTFWLISFPIGPLLIILVMSMLTGLVAGLIPIWRIARLSPAVAVKKDY